MKSVMVRIVLTSLMSQNRVPNDLLNVRHFILNQAAPEARFVTGVYFGMNAF
jgi:hypothetical protein